MGKIRIATLIKENSLKKLIISTVNKILDDVEILYIDDEIDIFKQKNLKQFDLLFWDTDAYPIDKNNQPAMGFFHDIEVIMISSKQNNAFDAYTMGVLDFILKPITSKRLALSIEKVNSLWELKKLAKEESNTNEAYHFSPPTPVKVIAVHSLNDVKIIPVDTIVYLQSEGRYTLIYTTTNQTIVSSKNLGVYEQLLAQNNFFRIHNSFLVNVELSVKIHKKDGMYLQTTNNNKWLPISKRRVDDFYRYLGVKF